MSRMEAVHWNRRLAFGVWAGLFAAAVIIVSRRMVGVFSNEVPEIGTCAIAVVATALGLMANLLFHLKGPHETRKGMRVAGGVVTLVPAAAIGFALAPSAGTVCIPFLGTLFLLACAALPLISDGKRGRTPERPVPLAGPPGDSDRADSLSQWLTRSPGEHGQESIEGVFHVSFDAGQKQATLHIPFSPPFASLPEVSCEVVNDCSARTKVGATYAYGTRIDVRRSSGVKLATVAEIGFRAVATQATACNRHC